MHFDNRYKHIYLLFFDHLSFFTLTFWVYQMSYFKIIINFNCCVTFTIAITSFFFFFFTIQDQSPQMNVKLTVGLRNFLLPKKALHFPSSISSKYYTLD